FLRRALCRPAVADAADAFAVFRQAGRAAGLVRRAAKREVRAAAVRGPAVRQAHRAAEPGVPTSVQGLPGGAQADPRGQREGPEGAERPAGRGAEPLSDRPQLLAVL